MTQAPPTSSATPAGLRRFAAVAVAWCVLLLLAGANVKTRDGGLTIPDWPWMFGELVPGWDLVKAFLGPAALRAEFVHRVIATAMGALTVALALWAWRSEPRRWVRRLCWAAVLLVIAQGVFGGLGVLYMLEGPWPLLHSTTAQIYLCLLVTIATVMSRWWHTARTRPIDGQALGLMRLSLVASGLLFVQLVLGAAARHALLPSEVHAVFAMPVAIVLVKLVLTGAGDLPAEMTALRRPAAWIGVLLGAQVGLGLWSDLIDAANQRQHVHALHEIAVVNAHLVVGALILALTYLLVLRTFRVYGLPTDESVADAARHVPTPVNA